MDYRPQSEILQKFTRAIPLSSIYSLQHFIAAACIAFEMKY